MDALAQLVAAKKKDRVGSEKKSAGGWKRKADIEAERKRQYLKDEAEYEKEQEVKRRKKEEERDAENKPIETSYEARMLHWKEKTISADTARGLSGDDLASMMAAYLTLYDTKLRDAFVKACKCLAEIFADEIISGAVLVESTGEDADVNELHAMIWAKLEKKNVGKLGMKIRLRSFLKLCSSGPVGEREKKEKEDEPKSAPPERKGDVDEKPKSKEEPATEMEAKPISTEDGPPREEAYSKEGYVDACVEHYLSLWKVEVYTTMSVEEKGTREGRNTISRLEQTINWLKPLQRLLRKAMLKKDVLDGLGNIFAAVGKRDYVTANRVYLEQLAIGKAPWPMGATMVGIHARAAREKISEDKIAHVMNDEQTRKYIQSVKRLITVAERHYPASELP